MVIRMRAQEGLFELSEGHFRSLAGFYPEIDVGSELRSLAAWLEGNPARRPPLRDMPRFLNNCLNKEKKALRERARPEAKDRQRAPLDGQARETFADNLKRLKLGECANG